MDFLGFIRRYNPGLENWLRKDWILYFCVVPAILVIIFLLPQSIKEQYFIFNVEHPTIFSIFLHNYTHSTIPHITNNLTIYLFTMFSLFGIENDKQRFYLVSALLFLLLPFISTLPILYLLDWIPPAQGFSAIASGFLGYLIYASFKFIKQRFALERANLLAIIILGNFLLTPMLYKETLLMVVLFSFMIVLIFLERRNIRRIFIATIDYFREIPRRAFFEALYKYFLIAIPTALCFALSLLLPSVFVNNGNLTNILSHYIGWVCGNSFPILIDWLNKRGV